MTATDSALRSFVAVPLPGAVQAEIADAARVLARELPAVRWVRKVENLHVTLKFLGPVAAERLTEIGSMLERALAVVPRFAVRLRGFGAFPSPANANILYAAVDDHDGRALAGVAAVVEDVAAGLEIARAERPFTGHVTVGRCREGAVVDVRAALAPWAERSLGTVAVDEVHVYESRLGQQDGEGSTYVLRSRVALAPRGSN
jgi:2'-5' RNA ligase